MSGAARSTAQSSGAATQEDAFARSAPRRLIEVETTSWWFRTYFPTGISTVENAGAPSMHA
jgi:hypothetical protein